ncbi:MAG TPA: SpoIIE family protein phosphatase [Opitutaceae bacterium]|jgi:serine phosphatase RsbU (regulator of sigma subunit)|nr:SpoIIE family protein phosphatase [Opitutaceae bacterium]
MEPLPSNNLRFIEWNVASRPLPGEQMSGDLHLVRPRNDGALVAVVDGLGHGSEAAEAARKAIESLNAHPEESIISLVRRSHDELKATRGVAMTIALFNHRENTVTALGIGNVEAALLRANPDVNPQHESVLLRGGVVGYQLPALRATVFPMYPGDLMVFATDGIRSDFATKINFSESPQRLAERILDQDFRGIDDALVLAIRYAGASP